MQSVLGITTELDVGEAFLAVRVIVLLRCLDSGMLTPCVNEFTGLCVARIWMGLILWHSSSAHGTGSLRYCRFRRHSV